MTYTKESLAASGGDNLRPILDIDYDLATAENYDTRVGEHRALYTESDLLARRGGRRHNVVSDELYVTYYLAH